MKVQVNGVEIHVATGGRAFDSSLPTVLFLHGSGLDHRAWALQTRWFAFRDYAVLAPAFPGHSLSQGKPLESIEASAAWLFDFLTAVGVETVHAVGHSQGFLSALELAALKPKVVRSLTGIGTAAAIPVNPMLIETAQKEATRAADMMLRWGFGPKIHLGYSPTPGMQPIAQGRKIMGTNPLAIDLQCCANYQGGEAAVEKVIAAQIPTAMILAGQDKMTPIKAGKALAERLGAELTVLPDDGHMLPIEAPRQVLNALSRFISQHS